jgi:hypothetical protein
MARSLRRVILEQVARDPDWWSALEVALTRPPGVSERRADEDPWAPVPIDRPRRISDDLAWFRHAMERPAEHGFDALADAAAPAWRVTGGPEDEERLERLADRGVLQAAGFTLRGDPLEERDG